VSYFSTSIFHLLTLSSFFPITIDYPLLLIPLGISVQIVDGYYEALLPDISLNRTYYFIERTEQQWYAVERTVCFHNA
jgi:hypothetical protein